ncbi:MAG: ABC transporter permease [Chloroflexota bacterium]|jgi:peptide/nickel transport system permease protein|nr:ABC transporter permease [Chloroflexota bacterium]
MTATTAEIGHHDAAAQASSPLRDTLRSILRQRSAIIGLSLLALILFAAIFADVISPYRPEQQLFGVEGAQRLSGPCIHLLGCPDSQPQFLMGLDQNNRDVFTRVVHGARQSLQAGIFTVGLAIVVGTLIGAAAGYAGGWVDNVLMRFMDVLLAFPALVLAIFLVTAFETLDIPFLRNSLYRAMIAIGIVAIPVYARVMRASVLSIREREFVVASRALGESGTGILLRRVLPNAMTPLVVQGTLGIATAILEVAALSFLGLGAQEPIAEWGSMIGAVRNQVFSAPHLILFPGAALALSVLAFNLLGDGLRDAMDPRLNR